MSGLKKKAGYSISAVFVAAALALSVDRYGEFAAGAESFASWMIPPMVLFAIAVASLVTTQLGHPYKGDNHA
ncbi:MAG: hypothetical protein AAF250_00910 [Pseudomonadota bacterium]